MTDPVFMRTASGRQFFQLAPRPEDITIEDIAHHLAQIPRWGGACRRPYSVAQHSVHVSGIVEAPDRLWALLHDASEAYLGDVVARFKRSGVMAGYRAVEAQLQRLIYQRFGLEGEPPASVHEADQLVLAIEVRSPALFEGVPPFLAECIPDGPDRLPYGPAIEPWGFDQARDTFLEAFRRIERQRLEAATPAGVR